MVSAKWNGVVVADSDDIEHVEGNAYFPVSAINMAALRENPGYGTTFCHWKGHADYYDVVVDDEVLEAAAWRYNDPYGQAENIRGHVAFWRGVEVDGGPEGQGYVEPTPTRHDAAIATGAPEFGENTIDVLQRYGYSDDDIAALQKDGVV